MCISFRTKVKERDRFGETTKKGDAKNREKAKKGEIKLEEGRPLAADFFLLSPEATWTNTTKTCWVLYVLSEHKIECVSRKQALAYHRTRSSDQPRLFKAQPRGEERKARAGPAADIMLLYHQRVAASRNRDCGRRVWEHRARTL